MNFFVIERSDKIKIKFYKTIEEINKKFGLDLKEEDEYPYFELLNKYIIIDRC